MKSRLQVLLIFNSPDKELDTFGSLEKTEMM
jgi:hypothetical protein